MNMTDEEIFAYSQAARDALQRCQTKAKERPGYDERDWKTIAGALQRLACSWELRMRREEFRIYFREAHTAVHRCWTADVGQPGYVKSDWRTIDNALGSFARDAAARIGIAHTEPLL